MSHLLLRADARRLPLADRSVDLVIGSPPYVDARLYLEDGVNLGIARKTEEWIDWMLGITGEALRVSRGLVLWVCAGKTDDWNYQPACEGLLYRWWAQGGICHALRPCYWHRVGIPGSGGEQWYRADIEYVLAFKRPGRLPHGDPKANGHKPKYKGGGCVSYRSKNGDRQPDGRTADPDIANPGNLIQTNAGGGHTGPAFALQGNEAPYPIEVPAFFINSHCPPGGTVLDCFSGSATTGDAALGMGRNYIGCDLRMSQCRLGRKRLRGVTPGLAFGA